MIHWILYILSSFGSEKAKWKRDFKVIPVTKALVNIHEYGPKFKSEIALSSWKQEFSFIENVDV